MAYGVRSPTISGAGINAILNALKQMGLDLVVIKKEAGLDGIDLEDSDLRLSCQYASDCYQIGQKYWSNDDFGLQHGLKYQPFSLGIVGHLLTTARTGLEALYSYEKYQSTFGEGLRLSLSEGDSTSECGAQLIASLWVHPDLQSKVDDSLVESFFVAFANCVRLLTGDSNSLLKVEFQRQQPRLLNKYERFFACSIEYSAEADRVVLSKDLLQKTLLTANPMLFQVLKNQSDSILEGLCEKSLLVQKVRSEILKCIDGNKIDLKRVATRLAMSDRTLQRKLHQEGETFKRLLDEVRTEFAQQQLRLNSVGIDEISYLLSYSEPGVFRKTFKRWTGLTPSAYRDKFLS